MNKVSISNKDFTPKSPPRRRQRKPVPKGHYYLRDRKSKRFKPNCRVPELFRRFAESSILVHVKVTRTQKQKKLKLLTSMLYQLIRCSLNDWVVADSRNTGLSEVKARVKLWNAIEKAGFLMKCLGSERSEKVTRYAASERLLQLRDFWPLTFFGETRLKRNSRVKTPTRRALVVIQSKIQSETGELRRIARPFDEFQPEVETLIKMEDRIHRINKMNQCHTWSLPSTDGGRCEAEFRLRQMHTDRPWKCTRLCSSGRYAIQYLSKDTRRRIQIDGRATAEPDFSGSIPRLLYHCEALLSGPEGAEKGDIYQVDQVLPDSLRGEIDQKSFAVRRDAVKRATNICINSDSFRDARGAVHKVLKSEKLLPEVQASLGGTSDPAAALIHRICEVHPMVEKYFFRSIGLSLMTIESGIMLEILEAVTASDRPALGIHDSVLCRREDENFVKSVMVSTYRTHTGFDPVVK